MPSPHNKTWESRPLNLKGVPFNNLCWNLGREVLLVSVLLRRARCYYWLVVVGCLRSQFKESPRLSGYIQVGNAAPVTLHYTHWMGNNFILGLRLTQIHLPDKSRLWEEIAADVLVTAGALPVRFFLEGNERLDVTYHKKISMADTK